MTQVEIDFRKAEDKFQSPSGVPGTSGAFDRKGKITGNVNAPRTPEGKVLTAKQIRARARRAAKRSEIMTEAEFSARYKPVDDWDLEELARGRPRSANGKFTGASVKYLPRDVHEKAMQRFQNVVKLEMNASTVSALDAIQWVLQNEDVDDKGKPIVSASTKLDAAKFLVEHVVGKPTQRIENDVSVKLQAILGVVMGNPEELTPGSGYTVGHLPGITMPMATNQDIEDADVVEDHYG